MTIASSKLLRAALVITILISLSACGGGSSAGGSSASSLSFSSSSSSSQISSSSSATSTYTVSGIATDGYIEGAQVCMDLNDNGLCDVAEPTAITSTKGEYQLTADKAEEGKHQVLLIAIAGQAADADIPNAKLVKSVVMATPKEYPSILSPLTTAVVATGNSKSLSTDLAAATIFSTLGINDSRLSVADLFSDFSSSAIQQSNPSIIKLANFAKAINTTIANQSAISESVQNVKAVIESSATAESITTNILSSDLIGVINTDIPVTSQSLQANLLSSSYREIMKRIDGFWFGTYYDKVKDKTYQICKEQGDSIITADSWITLILQADAVCPHANDTPVIGIIRASFSINPITNAVIINNGYSVAYESTGTIPQSTSQIPKGSGYLSNSTNPNTISAHLLINFNDGSKLDVNWDPNTSAPKTEVVKSFSMTTGKYVGRSDSDVFGTDFTVSENGELSGKLVESFLAPINKTYTCNIFTKTGYLIPGFTGYYMINNLRLSCTTGITGEPLSKTVNGYAIPVHSSSGNYGDKASVVGDGAAARMFVILFDASAQSWFFGSDNLVLQ